MPVLFWLISQAIWAQVGLVAHYDFETIDGDSLYDQTEFGNHGTNYGGKLVSGINGHALYLNGINAYARIPEDGKIPPPMYQKMGEGTISVWFRIDHIPTDHGIAPIFYYGTEQECDFWDAANQGLIIEIGHDPIHLNSKRLYFTIWSNGCTYPSFCFDSKNAITEGVWNHIVVVVGEDFNTGYLNGQEMKNRLYNFGTASYSEFFKDALKHQKMWIGSGYWNEVQQYFKGAIDELKIFDTPLSSDEVWELYQESASTTTEPISLNHHIDVFPSPANEHLHYRLHAAIDHLQFLQVMDSSGKVILKKPLTQANGHVDIDHLPDGLYYIDFIGHEAFLRKKIMILN